VLPGVSVAEELDCEVVFLVSRRGMHMVPSRYRKVLLRSVPLLGGGIRRKLSFYVLFLPALLQSFAIMFSERPRVVLGTGGYASFFPILAARTLGICTAVQEQNVAPGLATRFLSRVANRVFLSFPESIRWLPPKKSRITGNPLRASIGKPDRAQGARFFGLDPSLHTVLLLGGSLGAGSINRAFVDLLSLLPSSEQIQFIVISGEAEEQWVAREARSRSFTTLVFGFLEQIEYAYAAADLVVARAGATTIAELIACGKPSILVPYPHAGAHQHLNASVLQKHCATRVIENGKLSGNVLEEEIMSLIHDRRALEQMSRNCEKLRKGNAARAVAEEIRRCSGT